MPRPLRGHYVRAMRLKITPSFVVAVLALVVAAGGTGYAAGEVTSKQIENETVQSKDVRDGTLTGADLADGGVRSADVADGSLSGADVADGSLGRADLNRACAAGEAAAFGGCVRLAAGGPSSYQAAVADCNQRGGRLPTLGETWWITTQAEYTWADGDAGRYEFTGEHTDTFPVTPIALDRSANVIANASALLFWHHCVTS